MQIDVYDPVMCCSTGVCGPKVDPTLVRFAADLQWLQQQAVGVRRFSLGQHPTAFILNEIVRGELGRVGESALPLILVDGRLAASGRYPDRQELEAWSRGVVPGSPAATESSESASRAPG